MTNDLKPGDKVAWKTAQGETTGVIQTKVTSTARVKSHVAKASKQNPEYEVKSDKTGAVAIHRPGALKKRAN